MVGGATLDRFGKGERAASSALPKFDVGELKSDIGEVHCSDGSKSVHEKHLMASCCWEFATTCSPHFRTRCDCRCQSCGVARQVSRIASR